MAKLGVVRIAGKSGNQYKFSAYPLGTAFRKGVGAVFVVTRRSEPQPGAGFTHSKIRLGRTDDMRRPLPGQGEFLAARGANCICVHGENDRRARIGIQKDLLPNPRPVDNVP